MAEEIARQTDLKKKREMEEAREREVAMERQRRAEEEAAERQRKENEKLRQLEAERLNRLEAERKLAEQKYAHTFSFLYSDSDCLFVCFRIVVCGFSFLNSFLTA
jgi:hypothetical protein